MSPLLAAAPTGKCCTAAPPWAAGCVWRPSCGETRVGEELGRLEAAISKGRSAGESSHGSGGQRCTLSRRSRSNASAELLTRAG